VIFQSDRMLHRVMPSIKRRLCFTLWINGTGTNRDDEVNLLAKHLIADPTTIDHLCHSGLQRAVCRAVYAEGFEISLRECFQNTAGCRVMLSAHSQHLAGVAANMPLQAFVNELRRLKKDENQSNVV